MLSCRTLCSRDLTADVKRSKFPRALRAKRMMTNAPKYCLLRSFSLLLPPARSSDPVRFPVTLTKIPITSPQTSRLFTTAGASRPPPSTTSVSRQAATAQIEQNFFLAFSSTSFNTVRNLLKKRGEPPFTFRLVPTQMKMASATSFSSGRPFQKDTVVQVHPQKVKKPIFKREYHF